MFPELNCSCVKFWALNSSLGKALDLKHMPVSAAGSPFPAVIWVLNPLPVLGWGGRSPGDVVMVMELCSHCPHSPFSAQHTARAEISLLFPRSLRCAQAAKRAIQMETACPKSTFLIVSWQIKAIFLSCICSHENLHHAQALASLPSPAGRASPAVVWERRELLVETARSGQFHVILMELHGRAVD